MILTGKKAALFYVTTALTYFPTLTMASLDSEEKEQKPSVSAASKTTQDIPLRKPQLTPDQFDTLAHQFLKDQRELLPELKIEQRLQILNRCAEILCDRCNSVQKAQDLVKLIQQLYDLMQDKEDKRDLSLSDSSDSEDILDEKQNQERAEEKFKFKRNQLNKKVKVLKFISGVTSGHRQNLMEQCSQILQKAPDTESFFKFSQYLTIVKYPERQQLTEIILFMLESPKLFNAGYQEIYNLLKKNEDSFRLGGCKYLPYFLNVNFKHRWLFLEQFLRFQKELPEEHMGKILDILNSLEPKEYKLITDLFLKTPERHKLLCNKFPHLDLVKSLSSIKPEDREFMFTEFEAFAKIVHPKDWEQILAKLIPLKFTDHDSILGFLLASFPQNLLFPPSSKSVPDFMKETGPAVSLETTELLLDIYAHGKNFQEFKDFIGHVQSINEIANIEKKLKYFFEIIKMFNTSKIENHAPLVEKIKDFYTVFPKLNFSQMNCIFSIYSEFTEKITAYMINIHSTNNAFKCTKDNIYELLGYFSKMPEENLNNFLDFLIDHKVDSLPSIKKLSEVSAEKWKKELKKIEQAKSESKKIKSSSSSSTDSSSSSSSSSSSDSE